MRHLITGGSGFVGSVLAQRLVELGETVRVLDLLDDASRSRAIEFVSGSVTDETIVESAMDGVDIVHHHAAVVAQSSRKDNCHANNVEGTRTVAEAALKARVRAFIHISSTSVFGIPPAGLIDDRTPLRPFEPYGRSKLKAERLVAKICGSGRIPLATIRPRVTIGPGRLGIFDLLFDWVKRNRRVYISGTGAGPVQLLHVEDLVDFILLVLKRGDAGTFNVGTSKFGSLESDLYALIKHAGSSSRITHVPAMMTESGGALLYRLGLLPIGPWHYRTYHRPCVFDIRPLLAMGWQPSYSNSQMLCEAFDWYRGQSLKENRQQASAHKTQLRRGAFALLNVFA